MDSPCPPEAQAPPGTGQHEDPYAPVVVAVGLVEDAHPQRVAIPHQLIGVLEERLFDIVDQLNLGEALIPAREEGSERPRPTPRACGGDATLRRMMEGRMSAKTGPHVWGAVCVS